MSKIIFTVIPLSLVGVLLLASSVWAEEEPQKKLQIVCTTGMIADITSNVSGNRATVLALLGSGVDPHLYKPTRSDIATLQGADVVFYNGLLLEGKMTDALVRVAVAGKKVFAVTELIEEQYLLEPKEFAGHFDPHVWMDPGAWEKAVSVVQLKLSEVDPAGAAQYVANGEKYLKALREFENYTTTVLQSVPESTRVLVTAHDAFNYFGRRFGFEVIGIQGMSTESEAGVQDIERIVKLLVSRKIGAVFVESTVSPKNIQALIEGANAQGHTVKVGGELFSDAMGKSGTYEGTYIGMIDHNVTTIARALGGSASQKGFAGQLK